MDALLQFEKVRRARGRREIQVFNELRAWFFAEEQDWPFSFENVCAHLNLQPDAIRTQLMRGGSFPDRPTPRQTGQTIRSAAARREPTTRR